MMREWWWLVRAPIYFFRIIIIIYKNKLSNDYINLQNK